MSAFTSSRETDSKVAGGPSQRQRDRYARSLEATVSDSYRAWTPRAFRPLAPAPTVWACKDALLDIASALRDESLPISAAAFGALKDFMGDGASSPLYGRDQRAAANAAQHLRSSFIAPRRERRLAA
jgi:hypothetical protein